jgi:hypothetical protein
MSSVAATNWLTVCLVVVNVLYCYFTYKIVQKNSDMVAQMKAQYESFIAPVISVTIQLKQTVVVCLKVKNNGHSAAKNLHLSLDKDFYQFGVFEEAKNMRNFLAFQQTIPSFSPGEEIFFPMSQGFNLGKSVEDRIITPYEFTVGVRYEFAGQPVNQQHEVNLQAYLQSQQDRSEMLEELEKIRQVLEKQPTS